MTNAFDRLKGRTPAIIAVAIAAVAILAVVAVPVVSLFAAQRDDIDDALHRLALYRAEIDSRGVAEQQLNDLRQRAASEAGLIQSDSAALAQAQIQSTMKTIVSAHMGEVKSAQPLAARRVGGFEEISVTYDIEVPLARLSALDYAIESHAPYFFIDDAELVAAQGWDTGEPTPAGAIPKMEVRWTIRAYRWNES